jgi:nucleotide-binding universal stress UspA family protein
MGIGGAMLEWRKIGCAIDFSEPSRLAMHQASELARRFDGDLELVHVHTPPAPVGDVTSADVGPEALGIEKRMATWRDEAARLVGRPVRSTVVPGDAAAEIVRLAHEQWFDLIVVGTRGRRGLKRLALGSVAERVVREAPCAVLVVRREPFGAEARKQAEAR